MRGVAASTGTGRSRFARLLPFFGSSDIQVMWPSPPRIRSVIVIETVRRRAREATRATRSPAAFAVSFKSGLKSIDRPLHPRLPTAPQRLVQTDIRKQPRELCLPQQIFRLKVRQLGV